MGMPNRRLALAPIFLLPILLILPLGSAHAASSGDDVGIDREALDNELRLNVRSDRINDAEDDLKQGAEVNGRSPGGKTALMLASENCSIPAIRMLLGSGANPNMKDDKGMTPLIYAARESCLEGARLLVQHGANVSVSDRQGKTALDYAQSSALLEVDGAATRIVRLIESVSGGRYARGGGSGDGSNVPVISIKEYMPRHLLDQIDGKAGAVSGAPSTPAR